MERKMNRKIITAALAALALISVALACGTLAKYVGSSEGKPNLATSEEFFFTCNFEQGGVYLFPEENDFTFGVMNHNGLGVVNASDITYTVTVNGVALEANLSTLPANTETKIEHTIPASALTAGEDYLVTIQSSSPYVKTISFTVSAVTGIVGNTYTLVDKGGWVQLDLFIGTTVPAPDSLTIDYTGFAPDNTNDLMTEWLSAANTGKLSTLSPYTQYTLIFFGTGEINEQTTKTAITDLITIAKQGG